MQELLPGEASEPAEGQGEDALPGLRLNAGLVRLPIALLLAALSGLVLSLSLPPAGLWPVAYIAPIPLLWLLRGVRPRRGALLGAVFGCAYFGALLYWILLFGGLAWGSLVLLSAGYTAVFGALAPAIWRPERPVFSTFGLAALWTVLEWIRGAFPLGGFAWGQLGSTQVDAPTLPLASVTGAWGLSFLVLLVAGLLLLTLERWGRGVARAFPPVLALVLLLAPALVPVPGPDGRALDVAAIQVNVESVERLGGESEDVAVARLNAELHRSLAGEEPDLVVWGEGALDPGAMADEATMAAVRGAIASVGAPTVAGAIVNEPDGSQHTSTLAFDGSGELVDRYDKVRLVPFGEYVPWRSLVERVLRTIGRSSLEMLRTRVPVDRVPGERVQNLRIQGLPPFGAPICYENSFPSIDRAMVRQGAGFLVVTINNASYERTAASEQHLQMSRLRAVENGRWVVHGAVSGISALIDQEGRIVVRRGLFEPGTLRADVVASTRTTIYTRFGDWVPWSGLVLLLGLAALPRRRRPAGEAPPLREDPRVLVVLPTYDERETIASVLDGLLSLPYRIHVLVIDDSSPDGTAEIVRPRAASDGRVTLLERPRKSGLASAYAVGFDRALRGGYDLVAEMDSDLSHRPDELPRLLDAAGRHHAVIGSRYVPGGSVSNWAPARLALSRAGNRYARFCLGLDVRDATSGFRVYRHEALRAIIAPPIRADGYAFQIELVHRTHHNGFSIAEVPISFAERAHGRSKMSSRIILEALWLITLWGIRTRFGPSTPRTHLDT